MKVVAVWQEPYSLNEKQTLMRDKKMEPIRLEINAEKLRYLLNSGALCAADFRCLDCQSKQCVWKICLTDCFRLQRK
jgi:hypothetical protein